MNEAHIHLVLTHLPIVGVPLTLTLLIYGRLTGSKENERAALFALVGLAALTVIAKGTGEGAEDVLKALPDYPRPWVHSHEDMADKATLATVLLGVVSLLGLWKKTAGRGMAFVILVLGALSSGLLVYTGALGGQIRHSEIRADAQVTEGDSR